METKLTLKDVLKSLNKIYAGTTGFSEPSNLKVAKDLGIDSYTALKALDRLVEKGRIECTHRTRPQFARQTVATYIPVSR